MVDALTAVKMPISGHRAVGHRFPENLVREIGGVESGEERSLQEPPYVSAEEIFLNNSAKGF